MALGIYLLTTGNTDNYVAGGLTLGISVILAIGLFLGKWNMSENARLAEEDPPTMRPWMNLDKN